MQAISLVPLTGAEVIVWNKSEFR